MSIDAGGRYGARVPPGGVARDRITPDQVGLDRAPEGLATPAAPIPWDAFLAWLDEDVRAEWVDGRIVQMSPVGAAHQRPLLFLARLLAAFVEAGPGGDILLAPMLLRLPTRPSGREPDLMYIAATHAERVRGAYVEGPADLVVEIVAPESEARDRVEKLAEYEAAGIPEYWLLDPRTHGATFFLLGADGQYRAAAIGPSGIFASGILPGFRLRVDWLWREPLPTLAEAIADIPSA